MSASQSFARPLDGLGVAAGVDAQEAAQNRADDDRLSAHGKYRRLAAKERLDSASSNKDLNKYFDKSVPHTVLLLIFLLHRNHRCAGRPVLTHSA